MLGFVARRLFWGAAALWVIATLCFFIARLAPGNPFSGERQLHPQIRKNLERSYGLDRPILAQYGRALAGYLVGDLGPSYRHRDKSVGDIVWPAFGRSVLLGGVAFVLALAAGIPIGLLAAANQNRAADHAAMSVAVGGICVPNFLLGPLLKMVFVFWIGLLPVGTWPGSFAPAELSRLILPAVTLAMAHVAYVSRLMRAGMLDVLRQDYIRTARAKGASETSVVLRHGLKNGITPVLTYSGPMAAFIVTGSLVVENVFAIPGLGQHIVNSAINRDYSLLMGGTIVFSGVVILFNLAVDVAYAWLDPRVRLR